MAVIDDILDISKLEAGKVELELADFHLGDTIRAATGVAGAERAEKGLALSCAIDPACDRRVHGDPVRLRQVLLNLIGNAVKFTERGGVEVRVCPDPADPPSTLIEVEDTGIGMSAARPKAGCSRNSRRLTAPSPAASADRAWGWRSAAN